VDGADDVKSESLNG